MSKNQLSMETSPYLRQHSTNPVDWYPWGDDAFTKASKENKPIFLSIGYSACHWCHVMENESFLDEETASILNRAFVSIKVDREERPDVDGVYMEACRLLTGTGGWPLTIFLTPDKKPFYAGTYFPKRSRYGISGFIELLLIIEKEWNKNNKTIIDSAEVITNKLKAEEEIYESNNQNIVETQYHFLKRSFDSEYGGFSITPKFPMPSDLLFLAQYGKIHKNSSASKMLYTTLESMYYGGIFDHIGGGFARYSTDSKWLVPHFEKMLYDNAQLINIYTLAYLESSIERFKVIAARITKWLMAEMNGSEGGLFSAQDADSEGVEGMYYLFTPEEVEEVLGKERGKRFSEIFDITMKGNFEGKNIPNLLKSKHKISENDIDMDDINALYQYRKTRMELNTDDKYLSFWNSLAVRSLAESFRRTLSQDYLNLARSIYSFIKNRMTDKSTVYTSYKDGRHSEYGMLDDAASYISASIALYETTFDEYFLQEAENHIKQVIDKFWDRNNGGFFFTSESGEKLIIRRKEVYDGVTPSGNSLMFENFVRLSKISDNFNQFIEIYEKLEKYLDLRQIFGSRGYYCYAKLLKESGSDMVCVLPKDISKEEFLSQQRNTLFSYDTVCIKEHSSEYRVINGQPTYYVCARGTCFPPTNSIDNQLMV